MVVFGEETFVVSAYKAFVVAGEAFFHSDFGRALAAALWLVWGVAGETADTSLHPTLSTTTVKRVAFETFAS